MAGMMFHMDMENQLDEIGWRDADDKQLLEKRICEWISDEDHPDRLTMSVEQDPDVVEKEFRSFFNRVYCSFLTSEHKQRNPEIRTVKGNMSYKKLLEVYGDVRTLLLDAALYYTSMQRIKGRKRPATPTSTKKSSAAREAVSSASTKKRRAGGSPSKSTITASELNWLARTPATKRQRLIDGPELSPSNNKHSDTSLVKEPKRNQSPIQRKDTVLVNHPTSTNMVDELSSQTDEEESQVEVDAREKPTRRSSIFTRAEPSQRASSATSQSMPQSLESVVIRVGPPTAGVRRETVDMHSIAGKFDSLARKLGLDFHEVTTCCLTLRDPPQDWKADGCSILMRRDSRADYESFKALAIRAARNLPENKDEVMFDLEDVPPQLDLA